MMKLNLNPREALELLLHLNETAEPESVVDGVKQRLMSYLVSLLSQYQFSSWEKQTQKKVELLKEQNTNLPSILTLNDDDDKEERNYPKSQPKKRGRRGKKSN